MERTRKGFEEEREDMKRVSWGGRREAKVLRDTVCRGWFPPAGPGEEGPPGSQATEGCLPASGIPAGGGGGADRRGFGVKGKEEGPGGSVTNI